MLTIDRDRCTGCGLCVEQCPLDCLRLDENRFPFVKYKECWYCSACEVECPEKAIRIKLPYLVR